MVKIKKVVVKLLGLCLLILSVVSCQQDDLHDYEHNDASTNGIRGKTIVMNQQELMTKYTDDNLGNILKNSFEREGSVQTTMSSGSVPIYIDLDHIQVFESANMHAITYHVIINEDIKDANGRPELVYNLMYYSLDYKTYYVTLFRYDFTTISFDRFIQNPNLTMDVLGFIPLADIEDIYENIANSYTQILRSASAIGTNNYPSIPGFFDLADCTDFVVVEGTPCTGDAQHQYGDDSCNLAGSDRATPGYSYMDFSDCDDKPNPGGGGWGGGIVVPAPDPVEPDPNPNPTNPVKGLPIKKIGDFVLIGDVFSQINIGNNNQNVKTLKAIQRDLKTDLQYFRGKLNITKELGKAYRFENVNGMFKMVLPQDLPNPSGQNWIINIEKAPYYMTGVFHTHPLSFGNNGLSLPLFAHADLAGIFRFVNTSSIVPNRKPSEAFIGVVNEYGVYVVMLPNDITQDNIATKYSDFIRTNYSNKILPDPTKPKWEKIGQELEKRYRRIKHTNAMSDIQKKVAHEKALLKIIDENGLKLNLYFLGFNEGQFNGSWQKITLSSGEVQYTTIN